MEETDSARSWMAAAGLDLATARSRPIEAVPTNAAEARGSRFCPYTGAERVVFAATDPQDWGVVGVDAFTRVGGLSIRYGAQGSALAPRTAQEASRERGARDLVAASGMPLPCRALQRDVIMAAAFPPGGCMKIGPSGDGHLIAVAARHRRLYYVTPRAVVAARELPGGGQVDCWQAGHFDAAALQTGPRSSSLRASETLVYLDLADRLLAWDAGTGQKVLDLEWPAHTTQATARVAYDRVLVARVADHEQLAELYDLAQVARGGPCVPQSTVSLGRVPDSAPAPLWAESYGSGFAVMAANGDLHVLPFDEPPYRLYQNIDGASFGPARLIPGDGNGTPEIVFYGQGRGDPQSVYFLRCPLGRGADLQWSAALSAPTAGGLFEAPCVCGAVLTQAVPEGDCIRLTMRSLGAPHHALNAGTIPGVSGAQVHSLTPIICAGRALVGVEYVKDGLRYFWFGNESLNYESALSAAFTARKEDRPIVLLWDAAGVYLCDLGAWDIRTGRP